MTFPDLKIRLSIGSAGITCSMVRAPETSVPGAPTLSPARLTIDWIGDFDLCIDAANDDGDCPVRIVFARRTGAVEYEEAMFVLSFETLFLVETSIKNFLDI